MKSSVAEANEFVEQKPSDFAEFFALDDGSYFNRSGKVNQSYVLDAWWADPWAEPRLRALALALERSR